MRRVKEKVCLEEARKRLIAFRDPFGSGPYKASELADVIWPNTNWTPQGAGAAASRVLKRLGAEWDHNSHGWGWMLDKLP